MHNDSLLFAMLIGMIIFTLYMRSKEPKQKKFPEPEPQDRKCVVIIYIVKYLPEAGNIKKLCDKAENEQLLSMLN